VLLSSRRAGYADWWRQRRACLLLDQAGIPWLRRHRPAVHLGDHRVLTTTFCGHKLYVDGRDLSLAPHLLVHGFWEPEVTRCFCRTLRRGMRVADVGANQGYYALLAGMLIGPQGRLHVFEANPNLIDLLHANLDVNGYLDRAVVNAMAVAERCGVLRFNLLRRHRGSSSIVDLPREQLEAWHDEIDTVEIPCVSLDEYFEPLGMELDVLRMDAEGSEARILAGARRLLAANPRLTIFTEFAPFLLSAAGADPRGFLESLREQGFQICSIGRRGEPREADIDTLCRSYMADLVLRRPE
jgi:FkbM family methyltransferase